MDNDRVAKRHRRRLTCEIIYGERSQRAIVIDVSQTGLFVQAGARLAVGSEVEVRLQIGNQEPIVLRATVARAKQVPSQLTTTARGGVGLRIREAPPRYYEAIAALDAIA